MKQKLQSEMIELTAKSQNTLGQNIDMAEILERIPHRHPFLLIDRCEDYRPYESVIGIKSVKPDESYFQGHFPGNPVMPGVLIVESLAQTGAVMMSKSVEADVRKKTIFFMTLDKVRFRQPVRPGDLLRMPVKILRVRGDIYKFQGWAEVNGKVVAEAEWVAMAVDKNA